MTATAALRTLRALMLACLAAAAPGSLALADDTALSLRFVPGANLRINIGPPHIRLYVCSPLWRCVPYGNGHYVPRINPRPVAAPPPPPTVGGASAQITSGRFEAAIAILDRVLSVNSQNPDAWVLLGHSNRKLRRHLLADENLARALRIDPAHPAALREQGLLFLSTGAPERARANLATLKDSCGTCRDYLALRSALNGAGYPEGGSGAKWIRVGK